MMLPNFGHFERGSDSIWQNFELAQVNFICFGQVFIAVNSQILNTKSSHLVTLAFQHCFMNQIQILKRDFSHRLRFLKWAIADIFSLHSSILVQWLQQETRNQEIVVSNPSNIFHVILLQKISFLFEKTECKLKKRPEMDHLKPLISKNKF